MDKRFIAIAAVIAVLLAALALFDLSGGFDNVMEPETAGTMMEESDASNDDAGMGNDETRVMNNGGQTEDEEMSDEQSGATYSAYSPSVLANGETKVLFFHAPWCPVCRAADADLLSLFASMHPSRSVYKVDYDAETALKSRYGVTYQHTFVLVDGEGNAVTTIQGPTDAQLKDLIGL